MPTTSGRPLTSLALAGFVCVILTAGSGAVAQPTPGPPPAPPGDKPAQPATPPQTKPTEEPAPPAVKPERKPHPARDDSGKPEDRTRPEVAPDGKGVDVFTEKPEDKSKKPENTVSPYVLNHTVKDISGKDVDLSTYKGKVVVIVNVASRCGFTAQYEGLQELYDSRKDKGLVVLAFPANDFGKQEPGSEAEIKEFCETKFKVTFPMFSKVTVKGENKHPLYTQLAAQPKPIGGEPKWNFTKFVVDRSGNVVARFDAEKTYVGTAQLEPGLIKKVDELLEVKQ